MIAGPPPKRPPRSRPHPALVAVVVLLLGIAVVWPLAEIGPRGPLLVRLTSSHGIDARDLLALIPLAIVLLLIRIARHRARPDDAASFPTREHDPTGR